MFWLLCARLDLAMRWLRSQIKLERPKKVEATKQEGFICVGGFSNPLF